MFVNSDSVDAIQGNGKIVKGTTQYPTAIRMTCYPDTFPPKSIKWIQIPSHIDTISNTIVADSVTNFSRWAIGIPRLIEKQRYQLKTCQDTANIFIKRFYDIYAEGNTNFIARLALRYNQEELPVGIDEEALQLFYTEEDSTNVSSDYPTQIPNIYLLEQNYPNPFNPSTVIRYQLPEPSHLTIKIYNVLGQTVNTLVDGIEDAGYKSVIWNSANVSSGIYFYEINATSVNNPGIRFVQVKKMLLLR